MKRFLFLCLTFFFPLLYAQTPDTIASVRMQVWAELDAYPALAHAFEETQNDTANANGHNSHETNAREIARGKKSDANETADGNPANEKIFDYAKERMRTLGTFLVGGMIYGWNFSYTPSDKLRGISEYMEFSDAEPKEKFENGIRYKGLLVRDGKVYSWLEFKKTEAMIQNYFFWSSIVHDKIHGMGYGKISDGFQGIEDAVRDAIKNAVRAHFRTKIKNKPKEITGRVLLLAPPLIGISSGRYKVQLDFFLETDRITPYTQF